MMNKKTFIFAIKKSLPVLVGYLFLGAAFGIMFQQAGYNVLWAACTSILVYAGSGQFLLVSLITGGASLFSVAVMTLLINSRHIFYGLSFIKEFRKSKKAYPYMIFSLTDETYSVLTSIGFYPYEVDEGKANFLIALFNHTYWIMGGILGAVLGQVINMDFKGVEFSMTALFIILLIEQWKANKNHISIYIGAVSALGFLILMGPNNFILPSLAVTMGLLLVAKNKIEGNTK